MMIERQKIYHRNDNGTFSYILVLATTKIGMSFIYFAPKSANIYYKNIDSAYVKEVDSFAAFDMVLGINWNKCKLKDYKEVCTLSYKSFNTITSVIKDFLDGRIIENENGYFCYYDEIKNEEPIHSIVSEETIILEPEDSEESINCDDDLSETYIDLLTTENDPNTPDRNNKTPSYTINKSRHYSNKNIRRLYTIDEAKAISNMPTKAIMDKYNVYYDIASIMKRNAKIYFSLEVERRKKGSCTVKEMIAKGYSLEEIVKMHPDRSIGEINRAFKMHTISQFDGNDAIVYFDKVVHESNLDVMLSVLNMSIPDFCILYKCPYFIGIDILNKIKNKIATNPFLMAGLGHISFDKDIDKIIQDKKGSKRDEDIIMIKNYDTCMRLFNAYVRTYSEHGDILAGVVHIPSDIEESDKSRFLSMLNNRFYRRVLNKNRILTDYQKDILLGNNVVEVACEFMIDYKRAKNIMHNYKK